MEGLCESVLRFSEVVLEAVIVEYTQTTEDNDKELLLELLELAVGCLVLIEGSFYIEIVVQLIEIIHQIEVNVDQELRYRAVTKTGFFF